MWVGMRLIFSYLTLFFIPGYLSYRLIFNKKEFNIFERLPIYFALSLGIVALFGTLAYIFNFTFNILWGMVIVILLLSTYLAGLGKSGQIENISPKHPDIEKKKLFFLLIASAFLLSIPLVISAGVSGSILHGDALNFLGFVQKLAKNPFIANRDAFYKEITIDPTYGYNIWYLLLASVSWFSKVDPTIVWTFLPGILTPVILLSFHLFAKTLFKSKIAALLSLVLFIFYYGISEKMYIFRTSSFNMIVANFIVLPLSLTFAFRYFSNHRTKYLIIACFLGFVIATVHLFGFLLFLLSLSSFCLFHFIFKWNDKGERINILKVILISLIVISPYLALRLPTIKIINPYYLQNSFPDKPYFVEWLNKSLCYMNPKLLAAPHYHTQKPFYPRIFYIISFCLTPFLFIYVRKYNSALFLLSNMLIVPLVTLNPILVPQLAKIITFGLVDQLSQLLPFLLVLGFFSYRVLIYLNKFSFFKKNSLYILIPILILGLFNPGTNKKFITIFGKKRDGFKSYYKGRDRSLGAVKFIDKNIQKTSVFLCDMRFSLFIPAFTKHYVMVTHAGHASGATTDQPERGKDAKDAFDPETEMDKTVSILKKYDVGHIVLDLNRAPKSQLKFATNPEIFEKIYEENKIVIFKYLGKEL